VNVVDSCAWLEYLANGPNAARFARTVEDTDHLVVPTITVYEVFKRILQQRDEAAALLVAAQMKAGHVVDLDASLALEAARLGHGLKLPMADAIVLATAQKHEATIWTQDSHFNGLEGVKYFPRQP
jgi:predicted nucleic acid-binding protein